MGSNTVISTFLPAVIGAKEKPVIVLGFSGDGCTIVADLETGRARAVLTSNVYIDFSCLPREQQDIVSAMRVRHQETPE